MDIFKYGPVFDTFDLRNGILIPDLKSITWIERYRDPGEFTLVADVDSGVKEMLPVGTLISHIQSNEIMVVENHEISDANSDDFTITITGRSLETIFEQRIVGANQTFPAGPPVPFIMNATYTWLQAESLLNGHVNPTYAIDPGDAFHGIEMVNTITRTNGEVVQREIKSGTLYDGLIDLLSIEKLGIRIKRPYTRKPTPNPLTQFEIHEGRDLTQQVIFAFDSGDITNADYLWSNKNNKNSVLVTSKWTQVMLKQYTGYQRRVVVVDGSDVDSHINDQPDAAGIQAIQSALYILGNQVLSRSNDVALSKAQAGKNSKKYVYRKDFDVGDIVMIDGLFNESSPMRVIEYVEIYDDKGSSQYPTLSLYPEES